MLKVALGQFAVSKTWEENAQTSLDLMARAHAGGADLLVLPEGILARDITDPEIVKRSAQPLDGDDVGADAVDHAEGYSPRCAASRISAFISRTAFCQPTNTACATIA